MAFKVKEIVYDYQDALTKESFSFSLDQETGDVLILREERDGSLVPCKFFDCRKFTAGNIDKYINAFAMLKEIIFNKSIMIEVEESVAPRIEQERFVEYDTQVLYAPPLQKGNKKICVVCGGSFPRKGKALYCSKACRTTFFNARQKEKRKKRQYESRECLYCRGMFIPEKKLQLCCNDLHKKMYKKTMRSTNNNLLKTTK